MKKRLIEYDLPLADISEESAREKNIRHGHPSTLHIWWARRPLASSRATAFAALIDDPGEENPEQREYLLDLVKRITPWEAVKNGNSADIEEARQLIQKQYGRPPRVLDPFAGGGSIPLEALRLGCETYANDYNPVAVFIEKATLEWPQKFGIEVELPQALAHGLAQTYGTDKDKNNKKFVESVPSVSHSQKNLWGEGETKKVNLLAYLVEKWANIILEEARAEIGRFYPTENSDGLVGQREITEAEGWIPVGYLWARTIPCQNPGCGAEIPLVKQFWLAKKKKKKIAYRPVVNKAHGPSAQTYGTDKNKKENNKSVQSVSSVSHSARRPVEFELLEDAAAIEAANFDPAESTVTRGDARCLVCGQITKANDTRRLARAGQMGQRMVAVVLHHPKQTGKKYRLATPEDEHIFAEAAAALEEKIANWPYLESPLPEEVMADDKRNLWVQLYGFDRFQDLFNTRQKLALVTSLEKIKGSYERLLAECEEICPQITQIAQIKDKKSVSSAKSVDDIDPAELAKAVLGYLALTLTRTSEFTSTLTRWYAGAEAPRNVFARQALPMMWDYDENNPFSDIAGSWTAMFERMLYGSKESFEGKWPLFGNISNQSATNLSFADNSFDAILTDPPYYDNVPYAALSDFLASPQSPYLGRKIGLQFRVHLG